MVALFQGLSPALPANFQRELESLRKESDPDLLADGLFDLGQRLEHDRADAARRIYDSLGSSPVAEKARRRQDALVGRGAFGARAEVLLGHFFKQAGNPASLVGMAGAQAVFGISRLALLTRFAAAPASWATRGPTARILGSALASLLEAPAYVALARGTDAILGHSQDWSRRTIGAEVGSSYLSLGALRLAGGLANGISRRVIGAGPIQTAFSQASMLGGILLGQSVESRLGLREEGSGDAVLADSLATLLHLNVSGRLLRPVLAKRLEIANQLPGASADVPGFGLSPIPAFANAGISGARDSLSFGSFAMKSSKSEGGRSRQAIINQNAVILLQLDSKPLAGQWMIDQVFQKTGGKFRLTWSIVNPLLKRLEELGLIELSHYQMPKRGSGRPATVYQLTEAGRESTREIKEELNYYLQAGPGERLHFRSYVLKPDAFCLMALREGPLAGEWIKSRAGGGSRLSDGSLHPSLKRLEQKGLISFSHSETPYTGGRAARAYRLTEAGREEVAKIREILAMLSR